MNKWYAYLHTNGTVHVKRFFDMGDIDEAGVSPFVANVTSQPFEARDREHAMELAKEAL